MSELIDRDAVFEAIRDSRCGSNFAAMSGLGDAVRKIPTATTWRSASEPPNDDREVLAHQRLRDDRHIYVRMSRTHPLWSKVIQWTELPDTDEVKS